MEVYSNQFRVWQNEHLVFKLGSDDFKIQKEFTGLASIPNAKDIQISSAVVANQIILNLLRGSE